MSISLDHLIEPPQLERREEEDRGRTERQVGQRRQRILAQVEAVVPALERAQVLDRLDGEPSELKLTLLERVHVRRCARDELENGHTEERRKRTR
jgi:hypothetical protein